MKKRSLPRLPPLDANQRYSIRETQQYLRVSHMSVYARIRAGTLQTITEGRRRFVPGSELIRVSRLPA